MTNAKRLQCISILAEESMACRNKTNAFMTNLAELIQNMKVQT
jgi:hypothetical protein